MSPCPRCQRGNAPHRVSCLYCGAPMPTPSAAPPPVVRTLPPEVDRLVHQALSGQVGVGRVRAALEAVKAEAPVALPRAAEPVRELARVPEPIPLGAAPDPDDPYAELHRLVDAAQAAAAGPEGAARGVLQELIRRAEALLRRPAPGSPGVALPAVRQPYVLVVEGKGEAARAPGLALALSVDNATARLLAAARCPKVALRGEDPAVLEAAARQVRSLAGLEAAVVAREALREALPPDPVVGLGTSGEVDIAFGALWLDPEGAGAAESRRSQLGAVRLVVPGEVVIRRYRKPAERLRGTSLSSLQESGERRILVVDLHGEGLFLRLAEGMTDLRGLPGADAMAQRRSLKSLLEQGAAVWPEARLLESRICVPGELPTHRPEEEALGPIEVSGWALWEEHTRLCRVLGGLPLGPAGDGSLASISPGR